MLTEREKQLNRWRLDEDFWYGGYRVVFDDRPVTDYFHSKEAAYSCLRSMRNKWIAENGVKHG